MLKDVGNAPLKSSVYNEVNLVRKNYAHGVGHHLMCNYRTPRSRMCTANETAVNGYFI